MRGPSGTNPAPSTSNQISVPRIRAFKHFSSCRLSELTRSHAGIEHIAETVSDEIRSEHCDGDGKPGKGHDPPGAAHIRPPIGKHDSPFRRRWAGADPEERERGAHQNRGGNPKAGEHEN